MTNNTNDINNTDEIYKDTEVIEININDYMSKIEEVANKYNISKDEIINCFTNEARKLSENNEIDDENKDDFVDVIFNLIDNTYTTKKQIIIEIPDQDYKITVSCDDDTYYIKIPNFDLPKNFSSKTFFDVTNKSRNADIIEFITIFGEIEDKDKVKEIVNQFNKLIGTKYLKELQKINIFHQFKEKVEVKKTESYEAPEIMQEAEEILKSGNPHHYIMNSCQKIHTGDKILFSTIFLAKCNQSVKNSKGLQISANGGSSDGKTHGMKTAIRHMPKKHIIDTSLSSKALFYHPNLQQKTVIYSDDTEIPSDLENTLKRGMTNFQEETQHMTVDGEKKGKIMTIPKRMLYLFSSVEEKGNEELQNRKIQVTIEDSIAHKHGIVENQVNVVQNGFDPYLNAPNHEMLVSQAIFAKLHDQDFGVAIPFADRIRGYDLKNVRNNDKLFSMIMGFTLSKFMQREKDSNGNLIATEEDFNDAAFIFNKIYKNMKSNLTNAEIKMCRAISSFGSRGCTAKQLKNTLGIGQPKVSERLKVVAEKVPALTYEEGFDSEGTNDGGNTTSSSRKVMWYFLIDFDEKKYMEGVYLAAEKTDFKKLIEDAKKQEKKAKIEEFKELADNLAQKKIQKQEYEPKKLKLNIPILDE